MLQQAVSSRVLVGRSAELAALEERLHVAGDGHGSTVLVSGEAGVGKSRLVAEVSRQVRRVIRGHCFEPDNDLPFAPVLDLLRTYVVRTTPADAAAGFGPDGAVLARLLPELAGGDVAVPAPVLDSEQEKRRLFEALIKFFSRLAEDEPLLLVFEDLHWSDDTSLEFLLHLSRRMRELPGLLLLTYRSDEVQPSLRRLLATLDRERGASEIALRPLTIEEVDALLRAMFEQQQPIRLDFLHEIYALTEGNAFFIEEIVGSLIASGDIYRTGDRWDRKSLPELSIPRSVQHAVTQRSESLSPEARYVLQVAAVAGQRFDFDVILALTEYDEAALLSLIRELINVHLVVEESAERFAFRHALTRQAVYSGLLARERQSLHRALGETIERLYSASRAKPLEDLAYHFHSAQAWEKTLAYAPLAGKHAQDFYAPRAAITHFTRALDAAWQLSRMPDLEIYRERGQAYATLGEFDPAQRDYAMVLERSRSSGDRSSEWQALMDLGGLWAGYDYARTGEYFEQALSIAQATGDKKDIARSLLQLGNWQVNTDAPANAEESLMAALAIFEEIDDRHAIAETYDLLGIVADLSGDAIRMREYFERAIDLYRQLDNRRGLCSTLITITYVADTVVFDGSVTPAEVSLADSVALLHEALEIARDTGWRAGEAYALLSLAVHYTSRGRFDRSTEASAEAQRIAQEIEHREWLTAIYLERGLFHQYLLDPEPSRDWLERSRALAIESGSLHFSYLAAGVLATTCIAGGDIDAAQAALDEFDPRLGMETAGKRRIWLGRTELALAQGNPQTALEIIDLLLESAVNLTTQSDIPYLAMFRGEALTLLDRLPEAELALKAAREGATARERLSLLWRIHRALGELYRQLDRQAEAEQEFQNGRATIQQMAATIPNGNLRDGFLSRAASLFPAALVRTGKQGGTLTPRERDVAILVTQGLSNREIADTLFVGERTVETHVSNMLGKLGFTSRTQIAAWAVETGLTATSDTG